MEAIDTTLGPAEVVADLEKNQDEGDLPFVIHG